MVERCDHTERAQDFLERLLGLCEEPRFARFTMIHPLSKVPTQFIDATEFENRLELLRRAAVNLAYWWDNE